MPDERGVGREWERGKDQGRKGGGRLLSRKRRNKNYKVDKGSKMKRERTQV